MEVVHRGADVTTSVKVEKFWTRNAVLYSIEFYFALELRVKLRQASQGKES